MKITLVENGTETKLEFDRPVIGVGRSADNDIRLTDEKVSRHHCRIEVGEDGVWIVDLGSSNGTQVNGERITRCLLADEDRVSVGAAGLRVHCPGASSEAETIGPGARRGPLAEGLKTMSSDAQRERENLRLFSHITRRLVRETDLRPLLRSIVDSAVALVGAERGFLLMEAEGSSGGNGGSLEPESMRVRVARSFDHEDIAIPASRLSMGIAGQVVSSGSPVLSIDAGRDERFQGMVSVEDLKLRSVMCLPVLEGEGSVCGVLYVDNRLQREAFTDSDLDLVSLLADQASIAIRNARFVAELRERNERLVHSAEQIERLNEQLGRKVRDRDSQLAVVRAELERERGRYDYTAIVGASQGMKHVFQQLDRIIETELPVLIHGESGTGKELIARAIHFNGARKGKPFVTENCAALPDSLLESELFGHTRGAFTGAHKTKKGLLEQADGGSLFLDEIGDMSTEMQKKLLRVLQEGEFRMLGSNKSVRVNVRVIAASHQNLEQLVRDHKFREDLFYRINVLSIDLPPLRDRREDIPLLAEHLLARAARESARPKPELPREVLTALAAYDWPGNVRELENEMRRIVVLVESDVRLEHLSSAVLERRSVRGAVENALNPTLEEGTGIREAVATLERRAIEAALVEASGNKSRAAKTLGISRFALQRKLDKYGMGSKAADSEPSVPDLGSASG